MYDFLVVGAGLYGCTFTMLAVRDGYKVLMIDQRDHIAGAAYDELVDGVPVCRYGQHVFHTNSPSVWQFMNEIVPFDPYRLKVVSRVRERLFSFPINFMTMHQLWGVQTPKEAMEHLNMVRIPHADKRNAEGWLLSCVGEELMETFYRGYSEKQWHRPLNKLPAYIVRRIPIRMDWNDAYFNDLYEGMPRGGYTAMCQKMIEGAKVQLGTDFFKHNFLSRHVVYTGPIDKYFQYTHGKLEYNTLRFVHSPIATGTQGVAVMNHPCAGTPYLRSVEHSYFYKNSNKQSVISRDYPERREREEQDPFYPIRDTENTLRYRQYEQLAANQPHVTFGGRLGSYQYYNMDQTVMAAQTDYQKLTGKVIIDRKFAVY